VSVTARGANSTFIIEVKQPDYQTDRIHRFFSSVKPFFSPAALLVATVRSWRHPAIRSGSIFATEATQYDLWNIFAPGLLIACLFGTVNRDLWPQSGTGKSIPNPKQGVR